MAKWFTNNEFTRSATAERLGINNEIPEELQGNADYTLQRLDEIREAYGHPIVITSGYRRPALNKAVGGKPTSQHLKAQAADLKWSNHLWEFLLNYSKFDQLIEETSKRTKWIHISFNKEGERNQVIHLRV